MALNINYITDNKSKIKDFLESSLPDKTTQTTYNFSSNLIHIIKIELNKDDKPILFVLGGMSHKSFVGTSKIILTDLDKLKTKFKEIYLVEYDSFKKIQNEACEERDKIKTGREMNKLTNEEIDKIYKPEFDMNNQIANNINQIITSENLYNVHLLGKCNGAWIVTLLLLKNDNYEGLYLAVPGIAPPNVKILENLSIDRLNTINFVFTWVKQDGYQFNWEKKSFQEKKNYDENMKIIRPKKYKSIMYDNGQVVDPKIYHEMYPEMIDDIIKSF
jgi:hypothetical protein